jgi:hypothetical protein
VQRRRLRPDPGRFYSQTHAAATQPRAHNDTRLHQARRSFSATPCWPHIEETRSCHRPSRGWSRGCSCVTLSSSMQTTHHSTNKAWRGLAGPRVSVLPLQTLQSSTMLSSGLQCRYEHAPHTHALRTTPNDAPIPILLSLSLSIVEPVLTHTHKPLTQRPRPLQNSTDV